MLIPLGILSGSVVASAASYELISTTVLASTATSVTFSLTAGQQAAYKHLQIRMAVRTDRGFNDDRIIYRFNGDTGANYAYHSIRGNGTDVSASDVIGTSATAASAGRIAGGSAGANIFGGIVLDILDAQNTSKNKTARSLSGVASPTYVSLDSGLWMSTAAISSITLLSAFATNLVVGSRFSLYGVRG